MGYQIIKSLLIDFSDYVHSGVSVDDIDETIEKVVQKHKGCFVRPINGMLVYEIKTLLTKDSDISIIGNAIIDELDIKLVEVTENETLTNFRRN